MLFLQLFQSPPPLKKLLLGGVVTLLCLTFLTTGVLALRSVPSALKESNSPGPCLKLDADRRGQQERGRQVDRARGELETKEREEAAAQAKITLDQALQIASNQQPGRAIEGSLRREGDTVLYRVTILSPDPSDHRANLVFVNASDGKIVGVEKEEF